jgi:glycosyltransferase involved in cell wall biosynthesis
MSRLRDWAIRAAVWFAALPVLLVLLAVALAQRRASNAARRDGRRPRLIYGPTPIISIKYMSQAMRARGYTATTYVYNTYGINSRDDFDRAVLARSQGAASGFGARLRRTPLGRYTVFAWALRRFDVFHYFFDGGFLRGTPLRFLELQLLHLAGKASVVMPYGSDVAVESRISSLGFRHVLQTAYPDLVRREKKTLRQIRYFSRHADVVVGCLFHVETLERWDLLPLHYYPIDTDLWQPAPGGSAAEELVVAHTPNHRAFKGTDALIGACERLRQEGVPIRLVLLEGVPNERVREVLSECDVLAEQFINGYGLSAMEGMALGKAVLSNLSDPHYYDFMRAACGLDECPIVSTRPEEIEQTLRELATDPDRCRRLGEAGREFVLRFHSFAAVGEMWERVYQSCWSGEPVTLGAWKPTTKRVEPRSHSRANPAAGDIAVGR